jgi:hypothetical protein
VSTNLSIQESLYPELICVLSPTVEVGADPMQRLLADGEGSQRGA